MAITEDINPKTASHQYKPELAREAEGWYFWYCQKETVIIDIVNESVCKSLYIHVFYKKLGSGHSTKSFLISHEILSTLVLKVS